jgi:hypothetical protein
MSRYQRIATAILYGLIISASLWPFASTESYSSLDDVPSDEYQVDPSLRNVIDIDLTPSSVIASISLADGMEKSVIALDGSDQYKSVMRNWMTCCWTTNEHDKSNLQVRTILLHLSSSRLIKIYSIERYLKDYPIALSETGFRHKPDEHMSFWESIKTRILRYIQTDYDTLYLGDDEIAVLTSEILRLKQPVVDALIAGGVAVVNESPKVFASLLTPNFIWQGYLPEAAEFPIVRKKLSDISQKLVLAAHRAGFVLSVDEFLRPSTKPPLLDKEIVWLGRTSASGRIASIQGDRGSCPGCRPHILVLSVDFGQESLSLNVEYMDETKFVAPNPWNTWPHVGANALAKCSNPDTFWAEVESKIEELMNSVRVDESPSYGEKKYVQPDGLRKVILLGDAPLKEDWTRLREVLKDYEFLQMSFEPIFSGSIMSARRAKFLAKLLCAIDDECHSKLIIHEDL